MATRWDHRTAAEQGRHQRRLLADWLPEATTYAPYWATASTTAGMAAGEASTSGDLLRFTPIIQGDVANGAGAALVQRPTESQVAAATRPSLLQRVTARGDTGRRRRVHLLEEYKPIHVTRGGVDDQLVVASSRSDLLRATTSGGRAGRVLGLTDHDYLVSSVPAGPTAAYWRVMALALGSQLLALHPRGHGDDLGRCVDAFGVVPATAVACLPEEAVAWADEVRAADADVSRVVVVLLVGPPGPDDERGAVEEAWRAAGALERDLVVRHLWAPDVDRSVWAECREGTDGLHTQPELALVEVVDPRTGHATDGRGDLTITTLGWRGTTLLRYRTGDRVQGVETVPCPGCRRTLPRVLGPVERDAWHLRLVRDGRPAWFDTRALDDAVGGLAGIREWRVVVARDGTRDGYLVEVAGLPGAASRLAGRIRELTGVPAIGATVVDDPDALARAVATSGRVVDTRS